MNKKASGSNPDKNLCRDKARSEDEKTKTDFEAWELFLEKINSTDDQFLRYIFNKAIFIGYNDRLGFVKIALENKSQSLVDKVGAEGYLWSPFIREAFPGFNAIEYGHYYRIDEELDDFILAQMETQAIEGSFDICSLLDNRLEQFKKYLKVQLFDRNPEGLKKISSDKYSDNAYVLSHPSSFKLISLIIAIAEEQDARKSASVTEVD